MGYYPIIGRDILPNNPIVCLLFQINIPLEYLLLNTSVRSF